MDQPNESQVMGALEASGFLFEHECATALETLGLHVETSWPFSDPDQGKSRELDIRATKLLYRDNAAKVQVIAELLIECKDFQAPLVFLERAKNERELNYSNPAEYCFPCTDYKKKLDATRYQSMPGFRYFDLSKCHYYYRDTIKANQFVKVVRKSSQWVANHDGVHDGIIMPLAKAFQTRRPSSNRVYINDSTWSTVHLFFPIVLVRNRLLGCNPNAEQTLVERGRISYVRELDSGLLKGPYLFDFVSFTSLDDYVNRELLGFAQEVVRVVECSADIIRGGGNR